MKEENLKNSGMGKRGSKSSKSSMIPGKKKGSKKATDSQFDSSSSDDYEGTSSKGTDSIVR